MDTSRARGIRQGERDGAVLSVLVWQELLTGAVHRGAGAEQLIDEAVRRLGATGFVPVPLSICQHAVSLTKQFGKKIYGFDAVCLATALEHQATVFVTDDKSAPGNASRRTRDTKTIARRMTLWTPPIGDWPQTTARPWRLMLS